MTTYVILSLVVIAVVVAIVRARGSAREAVLLLKASDVTAGERAALGAAFTFWAIPMPWVFGMDDVAGYVIIVGVVTKVKRRRWRLRHR